MNKFIISKLKYHNNIFTLNEAIFSSPVCQEKKNYINQCKIKAEVLLQTFPSSEFDKTDQQHDNNQ